MPDTTAPISEKPHRIDSARCMPSMNGGSSVGDSPVVRPEKIDNSNILGTTEVTIISINAIEITAPVFCSMTRVPEAIPRRHGGTADIMALVFGESNTPEPMPAVVSRTADCRNGLLTWSVVMPSLTAAVSSMPTTARGT
jgi:hypothetical protein